MGDNLIMKIAITADIHLKAGKECPERFNALKNIFDQVVSEGINELIIAGDLFDAQSQDYSLFDNLCADKKYAAINIYVIPGNHDPMLNQKYFSAGNIKIFEGPGFLEFNGTPSRFFLIPYHRNKTMGEIIAKYKDSLSGQWVLIGHGDYLSGIKNPNTYESGVYMPLSRTDIEFYEPFRAILGHIHKKMEAGKVFYPGSPCGMDINETGRRSFMILDLNDMNISTKTVKTDVLYFNESLIALPSENEFEDIKNKVTGLKKSWELSREEISGTRIRLKVRGYTSDRKELVRVLGEVLSGLTYYNDEGPDISEVLLFNDPERIGIIDRVKKQIDEVADENGYDLYRRDLIIEQALAIILKE